MSVSPIDLINYCIERAPDALKLYALNPRVRRVRFLPPPPGSRFMKGAKRSALVILEMPEEVGVNLKGSPQNQDFMICFSVDRATYDKLERQAASGIVLPPGAEI